MAFSLDSVVFDNRHTAGGGFSTIGRFMGSPDFNTTDLSTAQMHREWLRKLPQWTGKSRTKIADETGIARTTLTKPLKADDPGTSTLSASTIDKIVRKYGIPPPGSEAAAIAAPVPRFHEDGVRAKSFEDAIAAMLAAATRGQSHLVPWTLTSRSLELEGYLPGDVVIVDMSASPGHGDPVYAEVKSYRGEPPETVMRVYESAGPVRLLVSRSMDPDLQRPLVIDDDRVVVRGVILPHRLRARKVAA